jgi:phage tail-like protein
VVKRRTGDDPSIVRIPPGPPTYGPVTLEQGVTYDISFEQWANKVRDYRTPTDHQASLKDFRKDIVIELYNEAGQKVLAYKCHRCWPSEFVALPDLDANANAVAIQSMVLQTEGWERDESVQEPKEPTFNDPSS